MKCRTAHARNRRELFDPHCIKYWSTPERAARVATELLLNASDNTGIYYDDGGAPMLASAFVRDPNVAERIVTETRALALESEMLVPSSCT